jgi:uncharacterized protein (TIGR02677 family)
VSSERRGRIRSLAYLNADRVELYRAILATFVEAKARFAIHLRPEDVTTALRDQFVEGGDEAIGSALQQLCEWGNLESHPDTSDVSTVEDFYRPRFLYQLSREGEAAEHAVQAYHDKLRERGELQTSALEDILVLLGELVVLCESDTLDVGKAHRTLQQVYQRLDELTARARTFLGSLQTAIDLHGLTLQHFLEYKEALIDYLERFIGELALGTMKVAGHLRRIDRTDVKELLRRVVDRELSDVLETSQELRDDHLRRWQQRWEGVHAWFVRRGSAPSQAEVLRSRARSAIPALLSAIASIHDRRTTRSDRTEDLRTLARWFAETDTEEQSHQLWRAAFSLTPSRHLFVTEETLEARDAAPVAPDASWLDAPSIVLSPRLRKRGRHSRTGRIRHVIDRSKERAFLEQSAIEEAEQIRHARLRLASGRRVRLSEMDRLDPVEFSLLLDLLGEAMVRRIKPTEPVTTHSSDGSLQIELTPTGDDRSAQIRTSLGTLTGRDQFVVIRESAQGRHG